ncbi:MAG: ankyrin repeat domain-containing protein [Candidatus Amoebophilus sp.]
MNFHSFQRFVARILLVSLCLQSCGGGFDNNSLIHTREKQPAHITTHTQEIIYQTSIHPLVDQRLTAQGGHSVTFYEYKGQVQASVESLDDKQEVYNSVPVEVKEATDLRGLPHLPKKIQAGRIHIQKTSTGKPARVVIHKGGGLAGGGKSEDEDAEKEPTYEEKFGNRKRTQAQIQQPNEKEKRYKPSNNQQKKESSYAPKRPRLISPQPVPTPREPTNNKTTLTTEKGAITFKNADKELNEASNKRARIDSSLLIQVKEELQEEDKAGAWQASMTIEGMGRSSLEGERIGNQTKPADQGKKNYELGKKCEELYEGVRDGTNIVELKNKYLKKAIKHYKKAIKQGHKQAQEKLAGLRNKGLYSKLDAITMGWYEQAIKGAGIEFKEFIEKAKATERGMKLSDLIVMQLDSKKVPPKIMWGGNPQETCYNPSYIFKPLFKLPNTKKYDGGAVMAIDPSGQGKCETAYCVAKRCGDYYFITALGGMAGGYDKNTNGISPEVRQKLLSIAQENKVHYLIVESNQGLPQFLLEDVKRAGIEELIIPTPINNNGPRGEKGKGKATRILDTLQVLLKTHRLIIDRQVLENDFKATTNKNLNYKFFYQLLTIGLHLHPSSSGSLKRSTYTDRLDAVAMAIGQLKKLGREHPSDNSGIDGQELHWDLDGADSLLLLDAAKNGDIELVKYLIGQGAEVNAKDNNGRTVLLIAAFNGRLATVKWLLENGASLEEKDKYGFTALLLAAVNGHIDTLKWLLANGASLEEKSNNGNTVLLIAAFNGRLATVKWLLENGASLEEKDNNGFTALLIAARNGHLATVKWLLENGSSLEEKNNNGYTTLLEAAYNGHLDTVKWLLENGASLEEKNKYGYTALLLAAIDGHLATVKWLLENGASLGEKSNNGYTALLLAAVNGHIATVKWLLENGASLEEKDKYGNTALLIAASNGQLATVKWLLANGASLEEKDNNGFTALLIAARNGHLATVKWLLENGSSLEEKDKYGNTALLLAAYNGQLTTVKWLLVNEASLEEKDKYGNTALLIAASNGKLDTVKWLLANGASLEEKGNNGSTALLLAAFKGHTEVTKYLIVDERADKEVTDNSGRKAIDIARERGHRAIVDILSRRPQG